MNQTRKLSNRSSKKHILFRPIVFRSEIVHVFRVFSGNLIGGPKHHLFDTRELHIDRTNTWLLLHIPHNFFHMFCRQCNPYNQNTLPYDCISFYTEALRSHKQRISLQRHCLQLAFSFDNSQKSSSKNHPNVSFDFQFIISRSPFMNTHKSDLSFG